MSYKVNAHEEWFEQVTVLGLPMLFTCERVDRRTVPQGLFLYEVRYDDYNFCNPVQLAKGILVNHYGTLLSRWPVELESSPITDNAYRDIDRDKDWHFEEGGSTLKEYMEKYPPKKEKEYER